MAEHFLVSRQTGGAPSTPLRSPEYLAENLAPRLLAVTGSLFALAMITVFLRFYVRIFMMKIFGWDGMLKLQRCADHQPLLTAPFHRCYDGHISGMFAITPPEHKVLGQLKQLPVSQRIMPRTVRQTHRTRTWPARRGISHG